jgi:hypothetical protein
MIAKPMKYHYPGFTIDTQHRDYQLWLPGDITHDGNATDRSRDFYQACWQDDRNELACGFYKGDSLADALRIFPPNVQQAFRTALAHST